jgi:hypothetical protein
MLVREQLMLGIQMNNFADDPESYPQYAAALPTMSRWQREAVLLLCGTDLGLSRRKLFLVLLGPSTIPGAGIGAQPIEQGQALGQAQHADDDVAAEGRTGDGLLAEDRRLQGLAGQAGHQVA